MSNRGISLAKEHLLTERRELQERLKAIDEILANIEAVERRSAHNLDLPVVRSDEFRGKRAVDALDAYLRARRGFKIPLSRAVADIVAGGVDPGQPRGNKSDPAALVSHTLKIALPNRRTTFSYEPDGVSKKTGAHVIPKGSKDEDIIVWLADTADQPKRRKRSGAAKTTTL